MQVLHPISRVSYSAHARTHSSTSVSVQAQSIVNFQVFFLQLTPKIDLTLFALLEFVMSNLDTGFQSIPQNAVQDPKRCGPMNARCFIVLLCSARGLQHCFQNEPSCTSSWFKQLTHFTLSRSNGVLQRTIDFGKKLK